MNFIRNGIEKCNQKRNDQFFLPVKILLLQRIKSPEKEKIQKSVFDHMETFKNKKIKKERSGDLNSLLGREIKYKEHPHCRGCPVGEEIVNFFHFVCFFSF